MSGEASTQPRPRRHLTLIDSLVRVPIGLLWMIVMAIVAVPLMIVMTVLYFACVHAVFVGSIRYRLAIEPLLIVLAVWGAGELWRRLTRAPARGAFPTAISG